MATGSGSDFLCCLFHVPLFSYISLFSLSSVRVDCFMWPVFGPNVILSFFLVCFVGFHSF